MSDMGCEELRDLAPEVALGAVDGAGRARALVHLADCASCRALVDELAQAADSLLLLAPEAEPSLGFETRVATRLGLARRPRWQRVTALAAAAVLLAFGSGLAVHQIEGGDGSDGHYAAMIRGVGGRSLRAAPFTAAGGYEVGQVFVYAGKTSWAFMTVRDGLADGTYTCELDLVGGRSIRVGSFALHNGAGAWGDDVSAPIERVRGARLMSPDGTTAARATFT